jgi:hypothetical protein
VRLAADVYRIAACDGFDSPLVSDVLTRCGGASRALEILGAHATIEENIARLRIDVEKAAADAASTFASWLP